jgi:Flp pilus assembly protein TadG
MTALRPLWKRDQRGAAALEFALAAPLLLMFILGITQLGLLFFANAGLRSSVAEGARYATIYPRPTDEQIKAKMTQSRFGIDPALVTGPTLTHGTSDGAQYLDISMSYATPLDFVFIETPPITISVTRRAFVQPTT